MAPSGKSKKSRGPPPAKAAAQAMRIQKGLEEALAGRLPLARVVRSLGNGSFRVVLSDNKEVQAYITGRVLKGGRGSNVYLEAGHFVVLQDSEIVSIVNRRPVYERLRKAGIISDRLAGEDHEMDDLFDRDEDADSENDIWGKAEDENDEKTQKLLRRYQKKSKAPEAAAPKLHIDGGADAEEEGEEESMWGSAAAPAATTADAEAPPAPSGQRQKTSARRLRAEREKAAAAAAAAAAEAAAEQAKWNAERRRDEDLDALLHREAPACWDLEDEDAIDIDAI